LSVQLPNCTIHKLHGLGGVKGYDSSSADLFSDGQAGMMGAAVDPDIAKKMSSGNFVPI